MFSNISLSNSNVKFQAIYLTQSVLSNSNNMTATQINSTVLFIENSEVGILNDINIAISPQGISLQNTNLEQISNSNFSSIINSESSKSSAIYCTN